MNLTITTMLASDSMGNKFTLITVMVPTFHFSLAFWSTNIRLNPHISIQSYRYRPPIYPRPPAPPLVHPNACDVSPNQFPTAAYTCFTNPWVFLAPSIPGEIRPSLPIVGNTSSPADKETNNPNGTSHTQIPKNAATCPKLGILTSAVMGFVENRLYVCERGGGTEEK